MAQRGRCGLLRCLLLLALADLEANPDRRRIRNLVRMWDCPYLPGCMAAARSKIGLPAMAGIGLIVAGVIVLNLFSKSAAH